MMITITIEKCMHGKLRYRVEKKADKEPGVYLNNQPLALQF